MKASQVYMTQDQIYDLFQACDSQRESICQKLHISSFGNIHTVQYSPQFQEQEFFPEHSSPCKENKSTMSHEHLSDFQKEGMILISREEYNTLIKQLEELKQQIAQAREDAMKAQQQTIQKLQHQVRILTQGNNKQQQHIFDLLKSLKKLETENHQYQDLLLQSKLTIQDQLKFQQQLKIEHEKTKLELLSHSQTSYSIHHNQQFSEDVYRERMCKSNLRGNIKTTEFSPFLKKASCPSQPSINRSFISKTNYEY